MKILIVGLGSIAKKHIAAIRLIDKEASIYALRRAGSLPDTEGIIEIYSYDTLSDYGFDFVIISNPTSEHEKTIANLLMLSCPLFIEKPLSNTLVVSDLVSIIEKRNILTYVACNLRFLDVLIYVGDYLQAAKRRINEINIYCGSYLPDWRKGDDFRKSYSSQEKLGGGVHLDLIHELDYLYWLFGRPVNYHKTLRSVSSLSIDSIDYANYIIEYPEFCANAVLNYYRRDYKRTFEIVFDDCTWLVDLQNNCISANGKIIYKSAQNMIDTYLRQMQYFYSLINTNSATSFNSAGDALEVLKICLGDDTEK